MTTTYTTTIIGAGNAGVSLAARLRRDGYESMVLIDPSATHRYRPMLNYTATKLAPARVREKAMLWVIPSGVDLITDQAVRVDADGQVIYLGSGKEIAYNDLVICPGLTPNWDAIGALREAFTTGWATSAHVPENVHHARRSLAAVTGGTVVFSIPPSQHRAVGRSSKRSSLRARTGRKTGPPRPRRPPRHATRRAART